MMAAITTSTIRTRPSMAPFWRRNDPSVSRQKVRGAEVARRPGLAGASTSTPAIVVGLPVMGLPVMGLSGGLPMTDSRIDEAVQDIGQQIDQDDAGQRDREERLREWVVPREDGVDQQFAESRPPEDDLDDAGPAEHLAELEPEHREDRDQRVP